MSSETKNEYPKGLPEGMERVMDKNAIIQKGWWLFWGGVAFETEEWVGHPASKLRDGVSVWRPIPTIPAWDDARDGWEGRPETGNRPEGVPDDYEKVTDGVGREGDIFIGVTGTTTVAQKSSGFVNRPIHQWLSYGFQSAVWRKRGAKAETVAGTKLAGTKLDEVIVDEITTAEPQPDARPEFVRITAQMMNGHKRGTVVKVEKWHDGRPYVAGPGHASGILFFLAPYEWEPATDPAKDPAPAPATRAEERPAWVRIVRLNFVSNGLGFRRGETYRVERWTCENRPVLGMRDSRIALASGEWEPAEAPEGESNDAKEAMRKIIRELGESIDSFAKSLAAVRARVQREIEGGGRA